MKLFNKAKGFTLIELAVVMVVTGTLAAVATPKLLGVSDGARGSTLEGLKSAMEATNESMHSKAMMDTTDAQQTSSIVFAGQTLATNYGWLAAEVDNMSALVDLGTLDADGTLEADAEYTVTLEADTVYITYTAQQNPTPTSPGGDLLGSSCYVSYTASTDPKEAPYIVAVTDAC